jgi:uncharacterized protein with GYD domain
MPTYVSLLNFTDQGIRTIRDTTQRGERAAQTAQKYGISFKGLYWTVGPYDVVNIFEAPDEESATAYMLEVGSWGAVRSTTLRAYEREEMSGIIERLGPSPST